MQVSDISSSVDDFWNDLGNSWNDEMSKKYKATVLDEMKNMLHAMQDICNQFEYEKNEALRKLKEIDE